MSRIPEKEGEVGLKSVPRVWVHEYSISVLERSWTGRKTDSFTRSVGLPVYITSVHLFCIFELVRSLLTRNSEASSSSSGRKLTMYLKAANVYRHPQYSARGNERGQEKLPTNNQAAV